MAFATPAARCGSASETVTPDEGDFLRVVSRHLAFQDIDTGRQGKLLDHGLQHRTGPYYLPPMPRWIGRVGVGRDSDVRLKDNTHHHQGTLTSRRDTGDFTASFPWALRMRHPALPADNTTP